MKKEETLQFFEFIGEIWRDITAIEFLMRCAIAKKDGDIHKLPQPPYIKGKTYKNYPKSFSHYSFQVVTEKFNKRFPKIFMPNELVQLRDALAHGTIAEINNSGSEQLIKFKETDKKELKVEFSLTLDHKKLAQIRQSLTEFRIFITQELDEEK